MHDGRTLMNSGHGLHVLYIIFLPPFLPALFLCVSGANYCVAPVNIATFCASYFIRPSYFT